LTQVNRLAAKIAQSHFTSVRNTRLCAEAQRGEIVCDAVTLERGGSGNASNVFGLVEKGKVKGREKPIDIRRMARRG
jgi:hypothetical protein